MRFLPLLLLSLAVLPPAPTVAGDRPADPDEIAVVRMAHLNARRFFDTLRILPAGIKGAYAVPQGDDLVVRGSASAVAEMRAAVSVADVALQDGHLVITLRHANPEAVRTAALALPEPGTVQAQEKTLQFEGQPAWLQEVQGLVFGAELTHPQPMQGRKEEKGALKQP